MVVIDGHGGYVPLYRIERATIAAQHGRSDSGETAVPNRDENHVTMACEAAGTALARSDAGATDLDAVFSASVTDPFAEHGIAAQVAYRHGASEDVRTGNFGGTPRAGSDALLTAKAFVEATGGNALVVGVDVMPAEPGASDEATAGTGAGALVLRDESPHPVATIVGTGQRTTSFVERHRTHGSSARLGDERFESEHAVSESIRPCVDAALAPVDDSPTRAVVAAPSARIVRSALTELPDATHDTTFPDIGYAGAASVLLDLTHSLEAATAGETVLAVSHGAGGSDAVVLRAESGVDTERAPTVTDLVERKEYVTYAQHLAYRESIAHAGSVTP